MSEKSDYKLIFKSEPFSIPSDFRSLCEAKESILKTLESTKEYTVQTTDVPKELFEDYIKCWVNRDTPDLRPETISYYEKLSNEFEVMKDDVEMYKRLTSSCEELVNENQDLEKQIAQKTEELEEKNKKYQNIYNFLFNNTGVDSHERFLEIKDQLFDACEREDVKFVDLLTRREVKTENGLSCVLNEQEKTSAVFRNLSANDKVIIPRSITFQNIEYPVTCIIQGAFKNSTNIQSVQFEDDSKLNLIESEAFSGSSLGEITIPVHVSEIGKEAFGNCQQLKLVKIAQDSELRAITKDQFKDSANVIIEIPKKLQGTIHVDIPNQVKYVD